MKPISEGFKPFGAGWWRGTGQAVELEVRTQTEKGMGAAGKFKPYSAQYADRKAGGKFKRQASTQTGPPNLELTGDMMRDLKTLDITDTGCSVGWPTYGERVRYNAEAGRPLSTPPDPFVKSALRLIDRLVRAKMREQMNATRGVKVIRVGK